MFSISKILHVTYRDHVTNEEVQLRTGSRKLADTVAERIVTGHKLRLPSYPIRRLQCRGLQTMAGKEEGVQRRHMRGTFKDDLTRANISWEEAEHTAMDRPLWGQAAAQCAYWHGRN